MSDVTPPVQPTVADSAVQGTTPVTEPTQPTDNPLEVLVPAKARKYVYALFGLVGIIMGALVIAYLSINGADALPKWIVVATAVYNFLVSPFSVLAASNVNKVTK